MKKLFTVGRLRFQHREQAFDHAILLSIIGKRGVAHVRFDGFKVATFIAGKEAA